MEQERRKRFREHRATAEQPKTQCNLQLTYSTSLLGFLQIAEDISVTRMIARGQPADYRRGPFSSFPPFSSDRRPACAFSRRRATLDGPHHQCLFMWSDKWSLRENDR
ncbi:PREDICTED: uncharacterized protein LOC105450339 isoform X2 [Wasmannia auropunctata]|uniref:uncharacterized protein LOC105450339 isoform X2 n=1 Tax=Wasmannia auropunctata TaxID=64793 RepID=UPI0005EEFBD4|nr:PREDICTED: uncharacterized protein LOC105450339 isoform X2 [Wasmannia auropunctata]